MSGQLNSLTLHTLFRDGQSGLTLIMGSRSGVMPITRVKLPQRSTNGKGGSDH